MFLIHFCHISCLVLILLLYLPIGYFAMFLVVVLVVHPHALIGFLIDIPEIYTICTSSFITYNNSIPTLPTLRIGIMVSIGICKELNSIRELRLHII
jgi:hypothetical protein